MNSKNCLNEEKLCEIYELNECVKWLKDNNYRSTALQFSKDSLEYSSRIALLLKERIGTQFYISYSTMCCVDYLSVQHLNESTVDSIIYFGSVCLTSSQFTHSLPVLHVFENNYEMESLELIESSIDEMDSNNVLILYDTSNTYTALELEKRIQRNHNLKEKVFVAKLNAISLKWSFTSNVVNIVDSNDTNSEMTDTSLKFGPFSLSNELEFYDLVIYLGKCSSLHLRLNCNQLLEIDINNKSKELINSNKEIRKRVALIEKFKRESCESIGIVFTNPLPKVDDFFINSKKLGKKLKKKIYFISLVQTIDEYKLGNFAELNGFVVVNSCFCSSALQSIDYCLPVLNWTEFEIAFGLRRSYGRVVWNEGPDLQLSDSDSDSDKSEVNHLNNQLIETKVFDQNRWFGLEVEVGSKGVSIIKSGQKGIASGYDNEDLL